MDNECVVDRICHLRDSANSVIVRKFILHFSGKKIEILHCITHEENTKIAVKNQKSENYQKLRFKDISLNSTPSSSFSTMPGFRR